MADKSVSIKGASDEELQALLIRLEREVRLQSLIQDLKRRSEPSGSTNNSCEPSYGVADQAISTEAPIESLYHGEDLYLAHYGVPGMKWGIRKAIKTGISNAFENRREKKKAKKDRSKELARIVRLIKTPNKKLTTDELYEKNMRLTTERSIKDAITNPYTDTVYKEAIKGGIKLGFDIPRGVAKLIVSGSKPKKP